MTGIGLSLQHLGLHTFKMVLLFSSYSKVNYNVTSDHLSANLKYFGGKLPTKGKKKTGRFCKGMHNLVESSDITTYMWVQLCIGYSELYIGQNRVVKGSLFVCCESFFGTIKLCDKLDICDSC